MGINVVDYSTLTVSNTAVSIATDASPVMPSQAHGAVITVETDQVRWRADGTDPTASEGHLVNVGVPIHFDSWTSGLNWRQVLKAAKFIRVTSDAALKITWFD